MICPKCQDVMRTVDKGGVHIDQCQGCRGIFLDRGELEQVVRAESSFYGQQAAPPPYRPDVSAGGHRGRYPDSPKPYRGGHADSPKPYRGGHADSPKPYRGGYSDSPRPYGQGHGHRRKRSFLEGLFD